MTKYKYLISVFMCIIILIPHTAGAQSDINPGTLSGDPWLNPFLSLEDSGPLVYHSYAIDDDTSGLSSGNGDHDLDPGETVELLVFAGNASGTTVADVHGGMSSADTDIAFPGTSESDYADISGWSTQANMVDYLISVDESTACGSLISFDLLLTSSGNEPAAVQFFIPVVCSAPGSPSNPVPGNGATDAALNVELSVSVSDIDGDELSVTFYGRQISQPAAAEFDIIAIPDTQYYTCDGNSSSCPNTPFSPYVNDGEIETFFAQMQWVVDNKASVAFVPHVGDLVQNADSYEQEWVNADAALDILENGAPGIPYAIAFGNHDLRSLFGSAANVSGDPILNQYFGVNRFQAKPYYGGHFAHNNNNHYVLFERNGLEFISIHLEYDREYEEAIIAWADTLLKQYPHRRGILVRHALIDENGAFVEGGDGVFNALKHNPNLFLLLSGHIDGEYIRSDQFNGRTIYTILSDYQEEPNGGDGWLRRIRFMPTSDQINVRSYSPIYDEWDWDDPDATGEQVLDYDMGYTTVEIGTVDGAAPGSVVSTTWSGLLTDQRYEWYAAVSDGTSTTISPLWHFTTTAQQVTCYPLTLSYTGDGSAPTALPLNSVGCSSGEYAEGELIELSAHPAEGTIISGWAGTDDDTSTSASNQVTMPGAAHGVVVYYEYLISIFIPTVYTSNE